MKKSINKKLRDLRAPVLRTAFQPLFSSSCALHDRISDLRDFLRSKLYDIHDDQDLFARTVFEEISQSKARLTTIERWLYVITFALIVELFLLIVLLFV